MQAVKPALCLAFSNNNVTFIVVLMMLIILVVKVMGSRDCKEGVSSLRSRIDLRIVLKLEIFTKFVI